MSFFAETQPMPIHWDAIEAIASTVAAVATVATVYFAYITIKAGNDAADQARQDADTNRAQQKALSDQAEANQLTRAQGLVMSDCTKEYFAIRSDTAKAWASIDSGKKQLIQDLYSERMYGLHFEEYHLFRQNMIPRQVYKIWIKSFVKEIQKPGYQPHYPPLMIDKYIAPDAGDDFSVFLNQLLEINFRSRYRGSDKNRSR